MRVEADCAPCQAFEPLRGRHGAARGRHLRFRGREVEPEDLRERGCDREREGQRTNSRPVPDSLVCGVRGASYAAAHANALRGPRFTRCGASLQGQACLLGGRSRVEQHARGWPSGIIHGHTIDESATRHAIGGHASRVDDVEKVGSTAPATLPVASKGAVGEKATVAERCTCFRAGILTGRRAC